MRHALVVQTKPSTWPIVLEGGFGLGGAESEPGQTFGTLGAVIKRLL